MCNLIREGKTLQEVGDLYGVTRERVRQLIKRHGLTGADGIFVRAASRLRYADHTPTRELSIRAKWGISREEYEAIKTVYGTSSDRSSPLRKYIEQRKNARVRGIQWGMTFADWWRIWQESGHWSERGRGQGYCMARWGDSGPYSPENVYICTIGQNFSDSYIVKPYHVRFANTKRRPWGKGWTISEDKRRNSGRRFYLLQRRDGKRKYMGSFESRELAQAAAQKILP